MEIFSRSEAEDLAAHRVAFRFRTNQRLLESFAAPQAWLVPSPWGGLLASAPGERAGAQRHPFCVSALKP